jgi:hypothetical protein
MFLNYMVPVSRKLRNQMKSSLHTVFVLGQKAVWDILPRYFYSGIPDIHELQQTDSWRRPSSMGGVGGTDIESQMRFLRECYQPPLQERLPRGGTHEDACRENG